MVSEETAATLHRLMEASISCRDAKLLILDDVQNRTGRIRNSMYSWMLQHSSFPQASSSPYEARGCLKNNHVIDADTSQIKTPQIMPIIGKTTFPIQDTKKTYRGLNMKTN